jgi:hypothetical protein
MLWGQSLLWKGHMSLHVDVQDLNDAAGRESHFPSRRPTSALTFFGFPRS